MTENILELKTKKYWKYTANIFSAVVIILLIWYLYENRGVLIFFKKISWQQLAWIALLDTISFLTGSLLNQLMFNRFDTKVSYLDCLFLQYVNNFLNKILPTIGGGAAFRAIYLERKYQFSYSQFISTVAGLYIISFFSVSSIGILCLWVIYIQLRIINWVIFAAFLIILLPCLFIILFSPQLPVSSNRFIKVLRRISEGWNILKKDSKFILIYFFFTVVILLLSALQTLISYQALGVKTNIVSMIFLSTLSSILAFVNFTPDGIGIKEGVYVFSAKLVQIPNNILILGSLVLRGVSFFTTLIFGGLSYWILMRQLKLLQYNMNDLKSE